MSIDTWSIWSFLGTILRLLFSAEEELTAHSEMFNSLTRSPSKRLCRNVLDGPEFLCVCFVLCFLCCCCCSLWCKTVKLYHCLLFFILGMKQMILSEAALNSVQELVNCVEKLSSLSSERLLQIEKCPSNLHRQTDPYDKKRITKRYKKWLKTQFRISKFAPSFG